VERGAVVSIGVRDGRGDALQARKEAMRVKGRDKRGESDADMGVREKGRWGVRLDWCKTERMNKRGMEVESKE
jgi:hypothetical protein